MTAITMFALPLAPLYAAIAQVESRNGDASPNVYQITRAYVDDVNRIRGDRAFEEADRFRARWLSEAMMRTYWAYYGERLQQRGVTVTYEALANLHRYGYAGTLAAAGTETPYWRAVRMEMALGEMAERRGANR